MAGSGDTESLFGALAEIADALVFVTAPEGRMLWTNATFVRETGYRAEDFWFENRDNPFLHPDDAARVGASIAAFIASDERQSEPIENRFFDKWGRIHSYRSRISKIAWEEKPALLFVTRAVDGAAPESKRGEADASYRTLVEAADDGIVKISTDGRFHFSNRCFHQLVSLDAVALKNRNFFDLIHPEDATKAREAIAALAGGACARFEVRFALEAKQLVTEISATRLDEAADAGLVLAIVRDVTDKRRIELKMREAQKLESLGVFAGGIAHDFNNLMTAVLVAAGHASSLVEPTTPIGEALQSVLMAGREAASLARSLLGYIGRVPTKVEVFDLRALCNDILGLARSMVSRSVTLAPVDGEAVMLKADRAQISQLVMNLVTNAAEAIGDRIGSVSIRLDVTTLSEPGARRYVGGEPRAGRYVRITVKDDGVGMSNDVVHRIFDPFFTTKSSGRGLGLSAVLGILRAHGGSIAIESREGAGSSFEIFLPASSEAGAIARTDARAASR